MSTIEQTRHFDVANAYEQHLKSTWDTLPPYEQEVARAYLQAKFSPPPSVSPPAPPPTWTVPLGYLCAMLSLAFFPVLFAPVGIGLGIFNASKGRTGHGATQITLSIVFGILGMYLGYLAWSA